MKFLKQIYIRDWEDYNNIYDAFDPLNINELEINTIRYLENVICDFTNLKTLKVAFHYQKEDKWYYLLPKMKALTSFYL